MTNPNSAMRMLIIYAILIPLAIVVGYLLSDPLNLGTLGFLGILICFLVSPIFIKWHYPILIFGLACPATCFFLPGKPPLGQIVVIISLFVAVTGAILNREKRFLRVPAMTWPLLFLAAVIYVTAKLNGGIHFHSQGAEMGGGKKYVELFLGIAAFFALTSQAVPPHRRKLYLMLMYLPAMLGVIGDLFPYLPGPFVYLSLVFPPQLRPGEDVVIGTTRLGAMAGVGGSIIAFLLARYGLRGILSFRHLWRPVLFACSFMVLMLGGFRNQFGGMGVVLLIMFFLEGLHRTRLMPVMVVAALVGTVLLAAFSDKLPYTFQRAMCFLPLKWNSAVLADAEGSSEWRFAMWRELWPTVPQHLLLGKGFNISEQSYENMGGGNFATYHQIDAASGGLALAGDYHSGPLSTLIPFGAWGAIGILWLMGATLFVTYRNYRYGEPELWALNGYLLAGCIYSIIGFFFIFGAFNNATLEYGSMAGFSLAMNGGLGRRQPRTVSNPLVKPAPAALPQAV
jgi:hypothetical protein